MARRRTKPTWESSAREIGINLLRAREAKGLSQERVAHMAGIAAFTYQKFEKGASSPGTPLNPRLKTLIALSQVLDVSITDLLPDSLPDLTTGR